MSQTYRVLPARAEDHEADGGVRWVVLVTEPDGALWLASHWRTEQQAHEDVARRKAATR